MNEFVRNPKSFEDIEERNEYFKSLSRNQKKVFVSLDILDVLRATKLKDRRSDEAYGISVTEGIEDSKELQEVLLSNRKISKCNGCAQAMAALCSIRVGNQIERIKDHPLFNDICYITSGLIDITVELGTFSRLDMKKIEIYYEGQFIFSQSKHPKASEWFEKFDTTMVVSHFKTKYKGERLIAIFKSIVKNNGKIVNRLSKI